MKKFSIFFSLFFYFAGYSFSAVAYYPYVGRNFKVSPQGVVTFQTFLDKLRSAFNTATFQTSMVAPQTLTLDIALAVKSGGVWSAVPAVFRSGWNNVSSWLNPYYAPVAQCDTTNSSPITYSCCNSWNMQTNLRDINCASGSGYSISTKSYLSGYAGTSIEVLDNYNNFGGTSCNCDGLGYTITRAQTSAYYGDSGNVFVGWRYYYRYVGEPYTPTPLTLKTYSKIGIYKTTSPPTQISTTYAPECYSGTCGLQFNTSTGLYTEQTSSTKLANLNTIYSTIQTAISESEARLSSGDFRPETEPNLAKQKEVLAVLENGLDLSSADIISTTESEPATDPYIPDGWTSPTSGTSSSTFDGLVELKPVEGLVVASSGTITGASDLSLPDVNAFTAIWEAKKGALYATPIFSLLDKLIVDWNEGEELALPELGGTTEDFGAVSWDFREFFPEVDWTLVFNLIKFVVLFVAIWYAVETALSF